MWKNYVLAGINVLISGLPIWITWDPIVGICYCGIAVLLLLLLSWNILGDWIAVWFVFHAKPIPQDASIAPALNQYLHTIIGKGLMIEHGCAAYYTGSKVPYCIPVGKRSIVISLALEERLERDGANLLLRSVPEDVYTSKLMFSRKVLLLSLVCYAVVIRIMELWAIFFAVAVKAIFSLAMLIATGALFGSSREMTNAVSLGSFIGSVALKINDIANYIQDKIISWIMKETFLSSFQMVEESGRC